MAGVAGVGCQKFPGKGINTMSSMGVVVKTSMKDCAGCGMPMTTKTVAGWVPGVGPLCKSYDEKRKQETV